MSENGVQLAAKRALYAADVPDARDAFMQPIADTEGGVTATPELVVRIHGAELPRLLAPPRWSRRKGLGTRKRPGSRPLAILLAGNPPCRLLR